MAKYFYGSDLYSDLFLYNNREIAIKMLLLDLEEPEATEFYIKDSDVFGGKASKIYIPYISDYLTHGQIDLNYSTTKTLTSDSTISLTVSSMPESISAGQTLLFSADINISRSGTAGQPRATVTYSDSSQDVFYNKEIFKDGVSRNIYIAIFPNPAKTITSIGLRPLASSTGTISATNMKLTKAVISENAIPIVDNDSISTNAIDTDVTIESTISQTGNFFTYGNKKYIELNVTNFYVSNINTILSYPLSDLLGTGVSGKKYSCNKYNKLIISNKMIQGNVTGGSLKVDGNSPMRRTIDFSCIVDKLYGTTSELKLKDFETKKIKVLLGLKDFTVGTGAYNYSQYFTNNGMQKDSNEIVWFKLGVFIPRNVAIKHSVDSYSISVTAQDKLSSLDGSFGGVIGEGIEFKDPVSGNNTSFYDTVSDAFSRYTLEPESKIDISFNDKYQVFKEAYSGQYVTAGSSTILVKNSSNIFQGMQIEAPGFFPSAKIAGVSSMGAYEIVIMDDLAYENVNTNEQIFKNGNLISHGATFSSPSWRDFFAIEPLTANSSSTTLYVKPVTINFKNSNSSYNVFTTISNWQPTTWGVAGTNFQKETFTNFFPIVSATLTGQVINQTYTSSNTKLVSGSNLYVGSNVDGLDLTPNTFYYINNIANSKNLTLREFGSSGNPLGAQPPYVKSPASTLPDTNAPIDCFTIDNLKIFTYNRSNIGGLNSYVIKTFVTYRKLSGSSTAYNFLLTYNSAFNQYGIVTMSGPGGLASFTSLTGPYSRSEILVEATKNYMVLIDNKNKIIRTSPLPSSGTAIFSFTTRLSFTDIILAIAADGNGNLYASTTSNRIIRYSIDENSGTISEIARVFDYPNKTFSLLEADSNGNLFAFADVNNTGFLVKYDTSLKEQKTLTLDLNWFNSQSTYTIAGVTFNPIDSQATIPTFSSVAIDSYNNVYLLTDGSYNKTDGSIGNIGVNFFIFKNTDLSSTYNANFFDNTNSNFMSGKIAKDNTFIYYKTFATTINPPTAYVDDNNYYFINCSLNFPVDVQKINAFRELAPQTDSTIVKSSSDRVTSILEDVKSQLGILQYYYDHDGNFVLKEDKRLTFSDPNYNNLNPYSFAYDDYHVNVKDIPFEYDFVANKNLITDYNNSTDLSTFKNDFLVYGTKKGLDVSVDSGNIPMLYHIMIDDLSLKNKPSTYNHPWQQYFIDQGIAGTSYANFLYFKELKENFEFKETREYFPNSSYQYVKGEYIVVNASSSGASASNTYLVYQVVTGGTPSNNYYPTLKDGTIEYLNQDLQLNTGLSVKFYVSYKAKNANSYQGIYKKTFDKSTTTEYTAMRKGTYFIASPTGDPRKYIFKITDIVKKASDGTVSTDDTIPISILPSLSTLGAASTRIGVSQTQTLLSTDAYVDLGSFASCEINYTTIEIYDSNLQYQGIFRNSNTGDIAQDFEYSKRIGDPSSWTYYFDIVNIIGNYRIDTTKEPNETVAYGLSNWAPNTDYYAGDLVYSDGKIYQALTKGTSGNDISYAPTGFGDSQNLIRDTSGVNNKLIWRLSQISINFDKVKVSAIGSRKNSINDKDINILFSQKDALAFFESSGYYFFVIDDLLGYATYSEDFHTRLENMIKQLQVLYPNIKLIFVPQSLINTGFTINKLTALKDAFSVMKRSFYLNFVNGQSININSVPIYNLEPLGIIRAADEDTELCGNFVLSDYVLPLSNEGQMTINAVKTHPYDDRLTVIPESITFARTFNSQDAKYNGDSIYV